MNMHLTIDILVPCYNESEYLPKLFDTLLIEQERWGEGFRVIFSDNQSTDNSLQIAEAYKKKFKDFKVLSQALNVGSRENWSLLLKESSADYFIFIDAHDLISEGLVSQVNSNNFSPTAGVIYMGGKTRLQKVNDGFILQTDNYEYKFHASPRVRFWQCVFYLGHCTEIHAIFPASSRNYKVLGESKTFNFDHTYLFFALMNHQLEYRLGGSYIRRYWPSSNSDFSHINSFGISETRFERAIGQKKQIVSNESMPDEILAHWSQKLTRFEVIASRSLLKIKYNKDYNRSPIFRLSRFFFGVLTPWKV
jgi:glycosyltransferase involved in cell wall biosynthesis